MGPSVRRGARIALLLGVTAVVIFVIHQGAAGILESLRVGGWGLTVMIPLHLLPQIPDAAGWRTLISGPRTMRSLYWIAWIRQAVSRLLPVASIGGELIGIRLLVKGGVPAAQAIASVVVEVFTTMLGQFLFVILGIACLVVAKTNTTLVTGLLLGLSACVPVLVLCLVILRHGFIFGQLHRLALKLTEQERIASAGSLGKCIDDEISLLCRSWHRLTLSTGLQLLGMLVGSLEVWAAYRVLGAPLSLSQALLLEALSQTAKHLIFFVPGGLGVQELVFMALSPVLGVSAEVSLTASLAKRAVDILVGVPALLSWQWSENRHWLTLRSR